MRLGALAVLVALAAGPVSSALDAAAEIDAARLRLDRAREQVARPAAGLPLVAPDGEALLAAFRAHLDALGPGALVDIATLEPDPAKPDLPRLRASIRGTAQGLHGLMHAVETGTPLVAVEEADLSVDRPADSDIGRPTILRLALTVRGVVSAPKPAPKPAPVRMP